MKIHPLIEEKSPALADRIREKKKRRAAYSATVQKLLIENVPVIARDTGLQRVLLFGSVARGEAERQSDIDLYIEADNDLISKESAFRNRLLELLRVHNIPSDVDLRSDDTDGAFTELTMREAIRVYG